MRFTKHFLDNITPPENGKRYLFDETQPGLGVMVYPSGTITFIYQDWMGNKKRRITLGKYGKITLKNAQDLALDYAAQVSKGIDVAAEKKRKKTVGITLSDALSEYLSGRELKERTVSDINVCMEDLKDWMDRPILEITRDMVAARHKKLGEKSPARANLTMRYLRAILNHASMIHAGADGVGLLPSNPVGRLSAAREWFKVGRRKRYLQEHEIQPWITAVLKLPDVPDREPGTGKQHPKLRHGDLARDFYMILLLTGLRRGELQGLKWEHVDFTAKTLTIPDPKNRDAHVLPLSDYLYDLLIHRKAISKGAYVLSGPDGKRFSSFRYAETRIFKKTGIRVSPHDLRRSFATAAESLNISHYAVKKLLNHRQAGDVTAGYIQITPDRLREPMQKITDYFLEKAGLKGGTDEQQRDC
jgi:integrase